MIERWRPAVSERLARDMVWNGASFGVMAVSGLLINLLIAWWWDESALGAFNQVYAVYIVLSQVAAAGVHLSVLQSAAARPEEAGDILSTALVLVIALGSATAAATILASGAVGAVLGSAAVTAGLRVAAPGIALFAVNKVLLALHNGLRRMRAFAVFQALRPVAMIAALGLLAWQGASGTLLPLVFTAAELVLFVAIAAYTIRLHGTRIVRWTGHWARPHLSFGGRALVGNLLAEMNTRVDVLLLGLFVGDATVGVYSFAAMLAEGFSQLGVVLRNVVNPVLTRYRVERGDAELQARIRHGVRLGYRFAIPVGLLAIGCYPLAVSALGADRVYQTGWSVFAVLMAGITVGIGYSAFQMVLNQVGFPGYQTVFYALVFATNVLLGLLLTPRLGMLGAALACASSFVLAVPYLKVLTRRAVGIRI